MSDPNDTKDLDAERDWMVERWHEYGKEFGVFVPHNQPAPEVWEPDLPPPDDNGRLDPQVLKHWEQLFPTKDFLRERYAKYKILEGPTLDFDCLVPKFHDRITHKWMEDAHGNPFPIPVDDKHEWYDGALRIGIFMWQVGFSCRSRSCERVWCDLHRKNPKRISPMDIYGLVALFEGISLAKAKDEVAKWFGVKLNPLKSKGVRDTSIPRRRVPKKAVYDLIGRYPKMSRQHVKPFVEEAQQLIKSCAVVPWHRRLFEDDYAFMSNKIIENLFRIGGPAIRAYLWLLIHQEEEARHNRWNIDISDAQLGRALGVVRSTAGNYRKRLQELKLVTVQGNRIKSVKY
jgi:hypothetical protein